MITCLCVETPPAFFSIWHHILGALNTSLSTSSGLRIGCLRRREDLRVKELTQARYLFMFFIFLERGKRWSTWAWRRRIKGIRRVRGDLHEVSSFYRHDWKIPWAKTMIICLSKLQKKKAGKAWESSTLGGVTQPRKEPTFEGKHLTFQIIW